MAGGIEIRIDAAKLTALAKHFHDAKANMPASLAQAVTEIGPVVMKAMKAVLPGQTGLKPKVVNKALTGRGNGTAYVIRSHGGDIRLKYFNAKETAQGVVASPWNSQRLYPATFIKSGWWPNRVKPIAGGQVLMRTSSSKYPIQVVRSGLFIPTEMVRGASEGAFYGTVDARLAPVVEAIILKAL
jgi:hypothetical protein